MTVFGPQALATTGSTLPSASSQSSGSPSLDMDAFLRMFTTQLQYQDPSNPLQSYELAAQLAQFSSVAELTKINQNLATEQTMLSSINNAQMVQMLGKQVTGLYNIMQMKDGEVSKGQFKLGQAAEQVSVKIYDEQDNLVRTMTLGKMEAGQYDVNWDGKDDQGNAVPEGSYRFDVEATDAAGNSVEATETVTGKVFAFRIEDGTPYLILDKSSGLRLPIGAVMDVEEAAA